MYSIHTQQQYIVDMWGILFDLDLIIWLKGQIGCLPCPLGLDREWLGVTDRHFFWPSFCFFSIFGVFDVGKIEGHASKMSSQSESCIIKCRELTFYEMQGVIWLVDSVCDIIIFFTLTFGIVWRQIWSNVPKFVQNTLF